MRQIADYRLAGRIVRPAQDLLPGNRNPNIFYLCLIALRGDAKFGSPAICQFTASGPVRSSKAPKPN